MSRERLKAFWRYCKQPKSIWDFFDYSIGVLIIGFLIIVVMWLVKNLF